MCVYISTPPATGPLHVGSSWPEQKMGSFGSFLYMNIFPRRKLFFGCPSSVVFYCAAACQWVRLYRRVLELQVGPRGFGASVQVPWEGLCAKNHGAARFALFWFQLNTTEGGQAEKNIFWPFCTFWTRVAITAPRRPKRSKPGSKAVRVLGNQLVAGFARRFGRLARQHVRCGAHMFPFQGQKNALGGQSNTRAQPRFTAYIRAETML